MVTLAGSGYRVINYTCLF